MRRFIAKALAFAFCWLVLSLCAQIAFSQTTQTVAEALMQRRAMAARIVEASPADVAPAAPSESVEEELRVLLNEAGVVFAGQVMSIRRTDGAIEIRWKIEDAVRGVSGPEFVQREWAGLWGDGDRYAVGQRSLAMLHSPSVAGFCTPVRGMDGVIPMQGDSTTGTVDLRWVLTHLRRSAGTGRVEAGSGAGPVGAATLNAAALQEQVTDAPAEGIADRATVLALMRVWSARAVQQ